MKEYKFPESGTVGQVILKTENGLEWVTPSDYIKIVDGDYLDDDKNVQPNIIWIKKSELGADVVEKIERFLR